MIIEHIAIWTKSLEEMKEFYCSYFEGEANELYTNEKKGFKSYFITFASGARLELMESIDINEKNSNPYLGFAHLAFKLSSKKLVDAMTEKLRKDGYTIAGEARTTGDGYYESIVLDIDGNKIELVA